MAEKFVLRGVEYREGMHLWSNPKLRGTPAEIPIILARPTLFDVVKLAQRYPFDALYAANRRLRACREISERQYLRTVEILQRIERAKQGGALTGEEVVAATAIVPEAPPELIEQVPTPAQRQRVLAEWLPAGLRTFEENGARLIRLEDVPWEFQTVLRRWLRHHLESDPAETSTWLIHAAGGEALTHAGWGAFLAWLTDALLRRLDQMEIGM